MLARYQIQRGRPTAALPERVRAGTRVDTRKHTRHCLRPTAEIVESFLGAADLDAAWGHFAAAYEALLAARFAADRAPFDALRDRAMTGDVYLGCNCPTARNPDVGRCHTALALRFMERTYPELSVQHPEL